MIKTIIVDGDRTSREMLHFSLRENCSNVNVIDKVGTIEDAFFSILKNNPDLVFMDIELIDGTAFDLLDRFENKEFSIIVVTQHEGYALKAYKYSAVDYILKPVNADDLIFAVNKLHPGSKFSLSSSKFNMAGLDTKKHVSKVALPTKDSLVFIEVKSIVHCKADGKFTICYLENGEEIYVAKNLGEFEVFLQDYNFIRVHRSHLINLEYIKKYTHGRTGTITMHDGIKVDVSQRKREEFLKTFNKI